MGESTVRRYVAEVRRRQPAVLADVMVPQRHLPGDEAEVDFGRVTFWLGEVETFGWMFVMRLSASGRGFHRVYLNEAQQVFLDGHVRAFEHFGGVPARVAMKNVARQHFHSSVPERVMWPPATSTRRSWGEWPRVPVQRHITRAAGRGCFLQLTPERKLPMLEQYFVKPATIDRIRGSWIAAEIETYVAWLVEQGYSTKSIWRRVPIAFAFGEFAR